MPNRLSATMRVSELPSFLRAGDALVFNDTKVIPAQLEGVRHREGAGGQQVSATLHMRVGASRWKAFCKPGKRIKVGDRIAFGHGGESCFLGQLDCTVEEKGEGGEVTLAFDLSGPALDEAIASVGHIPLPPYIAAKRPDDDTRPHRLPDDLCPRGRCRRSAHRRPAFHATTS